MKWLVVGIAIVAVAVAGVFAGLYFTKDSESKQVAVQPCGDEKVFGHIRSLVRKGDHYELRFDPAFWLNGVTANTAAAEDGAVEPGEPVPNDYYILDESRRTLKYLVRPGAHCDGSGQQQDRDPLHPDHRVRARGDRSNWQEQPPEALRVTRERRVDPLSGSTPSARSTSSTDRSV